jgi:5-guanidino-2-oxopentanoate decarboxylase
MSRSIGRYVVELLAANGIDTVFGIPGVHNLELYRGLAAADICHVLVRHEQGAGFAADGYARITGRAAAAFTISGPGLTNILTAAAQAYSDSTPMLVVATTPVRASLGKQWGVLHELPDQAALAAGVFGIARSAATAEDVRDHLRVCLGSLRTGRPRPAYLEIPLDVLSETTDLAVERFAEPAPPPQAPPGVLATAAAWLAEAARPVIVAGGGARESGAELRALVERLGCSLATTAAGKGLLPHEHPFNLGTSLHHAGVQQWVGDADVVLAVGTELGETDFYHGLKLELRGRLIRIDIDPHKLCDHYAAELPIWADAKATLGSLLEALPARARAASAAAGRVADLRAQIEGARDAKARGWQRALEAIRAALPSDAAVFTDMTQIAYFGNYAFPVDARGAGYTPRATAPWATPCPPPSAPRSEVPRARSRRSPETSACSSRSASS